MYVYDVCMYLCRFLSATHLANPHRSDGAYGVPALPATGNISIIIAAVRVQWDCLKKLYISIKLSQHVLLHDPSVAVTLCHCDTVSQN